MGVQSARRPNLTPNDTWPQWRRRAVALASGHYESIIKTAGIRCSRVFKAGWYRAQPLAIGQEGLAAPSCHTIVRYRSPTPRFLSPSAPRSAMPAALKAPCLTLRGAARTFRFQAACGPHSSSVDVTLNFDALSNGHLAKETPGANWRRGRYLVPD